MDPFEVYAYWDSWRTSPNLTLTLTLIGDAEHGDVDSMPVMKVDSDAVQTPSFVEELVNGVHDSVPESACLALTRILMDHLDVFSQSDNDLG